MKLFLASMTLLLSVAAAATPKVGDYSEFDLTVSQGAQSMVGTYSMAIVSEAGDQVSTLTTIHFEGQTDQVKEEVSKKAEMLNDQTIADVLTNCAQYGGTLETVTVPAGAMNSCKLALQENKGHAWIAAVPFGIAKQVLTSPEGAVYTLDLKRFINGQ
jgi:putative hemolysin